MAVKWVCAECGHEAWPDESFTLIDARYALGKCPLGPHRGKTYLVRENAVVTERKKKKKR